MWITKMEPMIYVDGRYFKTTIELFDEHIPVYNTLEEAMGMESR